MSSSFPPLTCGDKKCKTSDPRAIRHCVHCMRTMRERELYVRAFQDAAPAPEADGGLSLIIGGAL
jgi:hypothetical protein